jgi:predicted DNA binding CopG/RHH family protein
MNEPIPEFKNEDEERAFWAAHDSSEYVDWSKSRRVLFPNLKPGTRAISLRLPASMLDELRQMANQRDVPYQSLIKVFLRERIDVEHQRAFAVRDGNAPYQGKSQPAEGRKKKLP